MLRTRTAPSTSRIHAERAHPDTHPWDLGAVYHHMPYAILTLCHALLSRVGNRAYVELEGLRRGTYITSHLAL